jgi:hypothetical protein
MRVKHGCDAIDAVIMADQALAGPLTLSARPDAAL